MSASDHLSPEQFGPHGQGYYQRPLPGMEHLGANSELPVAHLFKHPEVERHPGEYGITQNLLPTTRDVRLSALRPTQPHVDEGYLYGPNRGAYDRPGAIQDRQGIRLVDGHHKVARALLAGKKSLKVDVWKAT